MTEYRRGWMPGATWCAFRKASPSRANGVYGSAVYGNISPVIKATSTGTWVMSRYNTDGFCGLPTGLIPVSRRWNGEQSIRRIGVARMSRILPQGSDGSDAVLFVHRIVHGLQASVLRRLTLCRRDGQFRPIPEIDS